MCVTRVSEMSSIFNSFDLNIRCTWWVVFDIWCKSAPCLTKSMWYEGSHYKHLYPDSKADISTDPLLQHISCDIITFTPSYYQRHRISFTLFEFIHSKVITLTAFLKKYVLIMINHTNSTTKNCIWCGFRIECDFHGLFQWWRHQMETFFVPAQRSVTRSFDVFFDLRLNERLSKQSWGWWFETPSRPLWRYSNGIPLLTLLWCWWWQHQHHTFWIRIWWTPLFRKSAKY